MNVLKKLIIATAVGLLFFNSIALQAQSVTLSSPSSSYTAVDSFVVSYTVSEPAGAPQAIQVVLTPLSGPAATSGLPTSYTLNIKAAFLVSGSKTFTVRATDLNSASNDFTPSPAGVSLPEGVYSAFCQYVRPPSAGGTTLKSTTRTNIFIDVLTQTPILRKPVAGGSSNSSINVNYTLPESNLSGTALLTFVGPVTNTFVLANYLLNADFNFSTNNISAPNIITSATSTTLPDGTYTVTLSYQDRFSHPIATVSSSSFFIQTATPTPSINGPLSSANLSQLMNFNLLLPSSPLAGSVKLKFTKDSQTETVVLNYTGFGTEFPLQLDSKNFTASPYVQSASSNSLSSGVYDVVLEYQDFLSNPISIASITNITLDNETLPPTLIYPTNNQIVGKNQTFNLNFSLPETPKANTVKVEIGSCILEIDCTSSGSKSLEIDPKNIAGNTAVLSTTQSSLLDGNYAVKVKYQDAFGNTVSSSGVTNLIIKTITDLPILTNPVLNFINSSNLDFTVNLPGSALNSLINVKLIGDETINIDLIAEGSGLQTYSLLGNNLPRTIGLYYASKEYIPNGTYTFLLSYKDLNGNDASFISQNNVTVSGTIGKPVITTKNSIPFCNQTADLSTSITSGREGLDFLYYSDSDLNSISNNVSASGTYYIKATNVNGLEGYATVTVNPSLNTPANAGQILGKNPICLGDTFLTFTVPAIQDATSYEWTLPSGLTGTSTSNTITVELSPLATGDLGNISVKGVNDCGKGIAAWFAVWVNSFPATTGPITGLDSVCPGQNDLIYTIPEVQDVNYYEWTLPPGASGVSGTKSISVNFGSAAESGMITVRAVNDCFSGAMALFPVRVNALPAAAGSISGRSSVCIGENSITYSVPEIANANYYVWTLPSGVSGMSFTNSITVDFGLSAVSGEISVTGSNDCGVGAETSLAVVVNEIPQTPVITRIGDIMFSNETCGNQWYNRDGVIQEATNQYFILDDRAEYYAIASVAGCVSSASNRINVTALGVNRVSIEDKIKVYPNPVTDELQIEIKDNSKIIDFDIVNLGGQIIHKGHILDKVIVPTFGFSNGVYIVRLGNGIITEFKKIIKQ